MIRKVQKCQVGLKLNGTHELLAYADDVILLGNTNMAKIIKYLQQCNECWKYYIYSS
jgi:hypothetical protein